MISSNACTVARGRLHYFFRLTLLSFHRIKKIDVSECQCNHVLSIIFPQLVFHWKASKNLLKTFNYLIESAAAFIAIHSNMQALSYLNEVESMIEEAESSKNDDHSLFFICAEDKARVEFLYGQVSCIASYYGISYRIISYCIK